MECRNEKGTGLRPDPRKRQLRLNNKHTEEISGVDLLLKEGFLLSDQIVEDPHDMSMRADRLGIHLPIFVPVFKAKKPVLLNTRQLRKVAYDSDGIAIEGSNQASRHGENMKASDPLNTFTNGKQSHEGISRDIE